MPGKKGEVTRAQKGRQITVYLSDRFGIWQKGKKLHVTFLKNEGRRQELNTSLSASDGLVYHALMMLYQYGIKRGQEE